MTDFDDTLNEIMNYGETGQSLALSDMYAAALARAEAAEAEALKQARRAEEAEAERDDLRESLDAAEEERNGQAILLADELNDARIEAAEAERDDLRERHDNLKTAYANLVQEAADRLTRMYSAEAEAAGLRARAEAAEAERDDANIAASLNKSRVEEMVDRLSFEMKRREALAARVAELEAQLAAQGWRPVTEDEPEEATEVELLAVGYRDGGNWYYHDDNPVRGWRPLPTPAPDTQEATTP